ncbi:MAG: glycine cleavage system protein GcvH [Thaumarchaeota archaeon]|nr:glycine cleavage system protein GcvH [Nitrososphaerota archaeon]
MPSGYYYTRDHLWIKSEDNTVVIGITDYGQRKLRDIVHIELPSIGQTVEEGEVLAVVESIKASVEIHSPVTGRVVEINTKLADTPELINEEPYEAGWIARIELTEEKNFEDFMEADEYSKYIEDLEESV